MTMTEMKIEEIAKAKREREAEAMAEVYRKYWAKLRKQEELRKKIGKIFRKN